MVSNGYSTLGFLTEPTSLWPEENDNFYEGNLTPQDFLDSEPEKDGILSILDTVESILDAGSNDESAVNPTPIGPRGVQQVVQQVDITENDWHEDEDFVGHLRSLLSTRKRRRVDIKSAELGAKKIKSFSMPSFPDSMPSITQPMINDLTNNLTNAEHEGEGEGDSNTDESKSAQRFRSYQSQQWYERFQDLLNFRQSHGHCLVPHKWGENVALAQWVKRQRYQYKLKKAGMHTTMTDERERALEQLGFVWDSHAAVWEERLNEIRSYRQRHGHCNVPSTYPENPPLSIWVKCQRRQYKLFLHGKQSNITQERISKLNMLGFEWNPRNLKLSIDP